jgi:hypothetical protein
MKAAKQFLKGRDGRLWIVAVSGDIWCANYRDEKGLGGDVVTFSLSFGDDRDLRVTVKGPWLSNSYSLFNDIGVNDGP